ncbi:hypothetical protein [Arthrobacter sp. CDRTa11]|uniref:hypothetical protein n=1 Tax=Arthrobacter sp. CDRTa11 TaxID=2651199 RepID=UPI0022658CB2|nr:hypothetical protein [Arthrobacter sp. CDRTa11]
MQPRPLRGGQVSAVTKPVDVRHKNLGDGAAVHEFAGNSVAERRRAIGTGGFAAVGLPAFKPHGFPFANP